MFCVLTRRAHRVVDSSRILIHLPERDCWGGCRLLIQECDYKRIVCTSTNPQKTRNGLFQKRSPLRQLRNEYLYRELDYQNSVSTTQDFRSIIWASTPGWCFFADRAKRSCVARRCILLSLHDTSTTLAQIPWSQCMRVFTHESIGLRRRVQGLK